MSTSERGALVSVVVGFLNGERFIDEAVQGVLAQGYPEWELWLVNDGSTDGSAEIARRYAEQHPQRISLLEHPRRENRGVCASRNLALRHATGRYVALLDVDDIWLPQKLERQVAILEQHPDAGMVYGASQYWHGWTGEAEDRARDSVPELGVEAGRLYPPRTLLPLLHPLGPGTAPCPSDLLLRRELVEQIGGFEEDFRGMYQLYEDQAFLAKVYCNAAVFVSDETWSRYRIHADSCMAMVKRAGREAAVRQFYLNWLERYLRGQGTTDPAIWHAFRQASGHGGVPGAGGTDWTLRVAGRSVARLLAPQGDPAAVRIDIETAATRVGYDIQLNLPRLRVKENQRYRLRFRARADRPRRILVGLAEAHEPWQSLGWHEVIELATAWRDVEAEFVAARGDQNARIHFDVGETAISVDLNDVSLCSLPEGAPVLPETGQARVPVDLGSLHRLEPISRNWGFDRGLPIDRYYIEGFLARHAADVRGHVLEIDSDAYTRQFGGQRVTRSDVLHYGPGNPQATIVGDLTSAPQIPDRTFDCVILTQTLQFIYDSRSALQTLHRILKPGGVLLATLPGISKTHHLEWDGTWYWGFTAASAQRLFAGVFGPEPVEVESFGNVLASISFLHGLAAEDLRKEQLDHRDPEYQVLITVRAVKANPTP